MTGGFVLDASMAMAWHFQDEVTEVTLAIEDLADSSRIVVPAHWHGEIANSLLMGERRGRTDLEKASRFLRRLGDLDLVVDEMPPEDHWGRILPLARAHRLTVYDTFYLELAERRGLALASLDRELNDAAVRVGITVMGDEA